MCVCMCVYILFVCVNQYVCVLKYQAINQNKAEEGTDGSKEAEAGANWDRFK